MEITVSYLGGVQFSADARGHKIVCDQPRENAGTDEGMTPPELLLVSLGTCAGYHAAEYLRSRSLPAEGLVVNVSASKAAQPARLVDFRIEVDVPQLTEERHRTALLRAVQACPVHNTLAHPPHITARILGAAEAGSADQSGQAA